MQKKLWERKVEFARCTMKEMDNVRVIWHVRWLHWGDSGHPWGHHHVLDTNTSVIATVFVSSWYMLQCWRHNIAFHSVSTLKLYRLYLSISFRWCGKLVSRVYMYFHFPAVSVSCQHHNHDSQCHSKQHDSNEGSKDGCHKCVFGSAIWCSWPTIFKSTQVQYEHTGSNGNLEGFVESLLIRLV